MVSSRTTRQQDERTTGTEHPQLQTGGRIIRGEPELLETKPRALERLAMIGVSVVLVPAVERGVTLHEEGER